jgi:hypothetical protein
MTPGQHGKQIDRSLLRPPMKNSMAPDRLPTVNQTFDVFSGFNDVNRNKNY